MFAGLLCDVEMRFDLLALQMTSQQQMNDGLGPGRGVIVTLLDSAPIRISVPAELLLEDPAFIQRVVQESLTGFKQQITSPELGSGAANPTS